MEYIIVQAGGLGSRMKQYTKNKPKSLVPVNNLPIIFYLFKQFPDKKFIVIGDYKKKVLQKYLHTFAKVKHIVVDTDGKKGTCSGIANALKLIPEKEAFLLIWSDLILPEDFTIPCDNQNYLGISKGFSCRWSYQDGNFIEKPSTEQGVAGLFLFKNKQMLEAVPAEGEFVAWLKNRRLDFTEIPLSRTKEYGLYEMIEKQESARCRPFNRIRTEENRLVKEGIDEQGLELAKKEITWYQKAKEYGIQQIPRIYQFHPLVMEKIEGKNIYLYDLNKKEKEQVLLRIIQGLKEMHKQGITAPDYFSIRKAYFHKTMERLEKVRNLIPGTEKPYVMINGKQCRNIYFLQEELEERIAGIKCNQFCFIHGDCTFSNILLDKERNPYFIDPRGYFGDTLLYGDPLYDWVKLYYSIAGNYDQFNLKNFELEIDESGAVTLSIASNGWEDMESTFFQLLEGEIKKEAVQLIHAIVWLSLTTYAWEDYDSICGAFYNGLYYLEDLL